MARARRGDRPREPGIGEHLASLNLFREPGGQLHITVAGSTGRRRLEEAMAADPSLENPMQVLASWIEEAGPRFVETWRHWRRG